MDTSSAGHLNYMNGISYFPDNPINRLMMVGCSFFLGEKGYYNPSGDNIKTRNVDLEVLNPYLLFPHHGNKSRNQIFYEVVNAALDFDFQETLEAAYKMRHVFMMRKSPMSILAIAADHPSRKKFNEENPGVFRKYIVDTSHLPGDLLSILNAWKNLKGGRQGFPSFIKRAMCDRLKNVSRYQANKYRKDCIDSVRLSHPKSNPLIDELMQNGKLKMEKKSLTWESLRSQGYSWREILEALEWKMPHMAALRNLRGFASEVTDSVSVIKYCQMLLDGVEKGKQFPFRYYTAYQQIKGCVDTKVISEHRRKRVKKGKRGKYFYAKIPSPSNPGHQISDSAKTIIIDTLEECMQVSIRNHPQLEGDVIILSDNSGSAHGCVTSNYGTNTVAEIGNLSALMTAMSCTGKATIGLFGDKLLEYQVSPDRKFLEQYDEIKELAGEGGCNVGGCTENGIWLFFKRAMANPKKYRYDHWFCYSDMQAGHGGLYGNDEEMDKKWLWDSGNDNSYYSYSMKYIHVPKLLENYRQNINPRLSAFMVQTAGYDDSILPQSTYRGAILTGWTGNEVLYAFNILKIWDQQEEKTSSQPIGVKNKIKITPLIKKYKSDANLKIKRETPIKSCKIPVKSYASVANLSSAEIKVDDTVQFQPKNRVIKKKKIDVGLKTYQRERNRKVKEREKKKNKHKY